MCEIVELSPLFTWSGGRAQRRRERTEEDRFGEGVKQMKIAASEAVVPMLSVHKFG
jgi:hypothetical protein